MMIATTKVKLITLFINDTLDSECLPPPPLMAAVLPASRSVQVGSAATAFATVINEGLRSPASSASRSEDLGVEGVTCGVTQPTGLPTPFTFQATDPVTNQPVGQLNTPVNIAPSANQTFVISLVPTAAFDTTEVQFGFNCANTDLAPTVVGLNTLSLTASVTPVPDIVVLGATVGGDGIVNVPGVIGTGAFAVATSNIGASGRLTATADTGAANLPVRISLCQTSPASGECLAPAAGSVTVEIAANTTPTFAIFVTGTGAVPFDPANNRVFVRFKDETGVTRGATSVAIRTQ
jgi:hypothetical protein